MIDPKSAIENIYIVAKLIYDQVQLVKANKAQCVSLANRVKIVEEAVRGLDKLGNRQQYDAALKDLLEGLKSCLELVKKFSESGRFSRWILRAGTYKEEFESLNTELQKSMLQLNLGATAQQLMNREQDKKDQAEDFGFIQRNQELIIELHKKELEEIQQVKLTQQEQHEVLLLQLASLKNRMSELTNKGPRITAHHTIAYYDLEFEAKIAEGSFGKVYRGKWDGQIVAIKVFEGRLTEREEEQFSREVGIMKNLRHPQIVSFYGACVTEGKACIIMEYMEQGALSQLMINQNLTPEQQKSLALDIAKGLQYLHKQGVLHRDLKSANILVNAKGTAKLADFGLAKAASMSIQTTFQRSQALQYQAPECFVRKGEYTAASDIYSFGAILWEIATGQNLSPVPKDVSQYANIGEREIISPAIPTPLANLIKACWQLDATQRPAIQSVVIQLEAYQLRPPPPTTGEEHYKQGQKSESQKDYKNAFESYQKSLAKGYPKSNTNIGLFFLQGIYVTQNKQKAYEYLLKGANAGHPRAMYNLASMLEYGDGVGQNVVEALRWYQKAAKEGDDKLSQEAQRKCQKLQSFLNSSPQYQQMSQTFKNMRVSEQQ